MFCLGIRGVDGQAGEPGPAGEVGPTVRRIFEFSIHFCVFLSFFFYERFISLLNHQRENRYFSFGPEKGAVGIET